MASQSISGTISITETFTEILSSGLITPQNLIENYQDYTSYVNGIAALGVDQVHGKPYTLVASTPQTIDLTSLTDLVGASSSFARVRELWAWIPDTALGHVVDLSPGASNGWAFAPTVRVFPGGHPVRLISDPTSTGSAVGAITGGSSKTLKMDPGSNAVTLILLVIGCFTAP